ncbi:hypothetical protein ACT3UH_17520, partial [Halomonas sp. 200]
MGMWFASGERQAGRIMQQLQGSVVESVRSVSNYEAALANVATWQKAEHAAGREGGDLRSLTPAQAVAYLEQRGEAVGQKTLDQERQAIQLMQQHVTGHLAQGERLPAIKSEQQQVLESRAYTPAQISAITERQADKNALATQIAHAAGLRAHEILTLRRADERPADTRPARDEKFAVRQGERYTVVGKGGLCREVLIPHELANRLEATRLEQPQRVTDRGVYYQSHYAISGGQRWSNSFSQASDAALGRSTGAHGLRHSY